MNNQDRTMDMYEKSKSVFLADDDDDDCMLFQEALIEMSPGVMLVISKDGEELMENLKSKVPPFPFVIFLDLNMPKKNGMECLLEMRNTDILKSIPVVVFSTSKNKESINQSFLLGANHYILKPNSFDLLKKTIQHVLSIKWTDDQTILENYLLQC